MKRFDIRGVLAFTDPLRTGLIHKTGGTVTQRTSVSAGIASDTAGEQLLKKSAFLSRRHGFDLADIFITIHTGLFFDGFPHQFVINHRIPVDTDPTVFLEHIDFQKTLFRISPRYDEGVRIL